MASLLRAGLSSPSDSPGAALLSSTPREMCTDDGMIIGNSS